MEARRLRTLFRNSTSLSSLLQSLRNFSSSSSSSSSSAAASPRTWKFFSDDPPEVGSSVYRHALKFQRPSTIEWQEELRNSVSFIGIVGFPLRKLKCREFGAYTFLNVKTSPNSNSSFRILLKMWNEMAEISIKHLKPNDCIYVSGHLGSYTKDENENLKTYYELIVKEINYVVQPGQGPIEKKYEESDSGGETVLERYKNRLHLWQVFFANPSEWLDNRKRKTKLNQPDFKNKDSGEALWIKPNDPSWIKIQLQLHDSRLASRGHREDADSRSSLSPWVYDD
ncbi:hypothetical protein ACSBR2_000443 [Camellia fascicularis]